MFFILGSPAAPGSEGSRQSTSGETNPAAAAASHAAVNNGINHESNVAVDTKSTPVTAVPPTLQPSAHLSTPATTPASPATTHAPTVETSTTATPGTFPPALPTTTVPAPIVNPTVQPSNPTLQSQNTAVLPDSTTVQATSEAVKPANSTASLFKIGSFEAVITLGSSSVLETVGIKVPPGNQTAGSASKPASQENITTLVASPLLLPT